MSSDDYQVQNLYRYNRKSFKKRRRAVDNLDSPRDEISVSVSPRSAMRSDGGRDSPACVDPDEGEVANIMHKKCPVISLAQQQLHRLRDEVTQNNVRCSRSLHDLMHLVRSILQHERTACFLLIFILVGFVTGLLMGAASCGTTFRQFNSPILTCIDNMFMRTSYKSVQETFRSVY